MTEVPARLRWQCRRGMLELDALLQGFLECQWQDLSRPERDAFETLLRYPDRTLLHCLTGQMAPYDTEAARVVRRIREGAAR